MEAVLGVANSGCSDLLCCWVFWEGLLQNVILIKLSILNVEAALEFEGNPIANCDSNAFQRPSELPASNRCRGWESHERFHPSGYFWGLSAGVVQFRNFASSISPFSRSEPMLFCLI
jgi:hypothetical protein